MATNHNAHIKSTTETLTGDLHEHLSGANRSITSWIKVTEEAGLKDVAKELQMLHDHIEAKDYAHVATSLTKLGKLTQGSAGGDEHLEELGKALSDAGKALSSDVKAESKAEAK
jgi:DNA-binding transcriptional ArsR family regulator